VDGGHVPRPPPLPLSTRSGTQLPTVWAGGTLTDVTGDRLELREDSGSVTVQRLAPGATGIFRVSGGTWARLDATAQVPVGGEACIEAAMSEGKLLALRVFLGAPCGPD
jgi:hypothetical protein